MLNNIKVYFFRNVTMISVVIFIGFFLGLAIGYSSKQMSVQEINYNINSKGISEFSITK